METLWHSTFDLARLATWDRGASCCCESEELIRFGESLGRWKLHDFVGFVQVGLICIKWCSYCSALQSSCIGFS